MGRGRLSVNGEWKKRLRVASCWLKTKTVLAHPSSLSASLFAFGYAGQDAGQERRRDAEEKNYHREHREKEQKLRR